MYIGRHRSAVARCVGAGICEGSWASARSPTGRRGTYLLTNWAGLMGGYSAKAAAKRREALKEEFWPNEIPWNGPDEVGYFCAPRTLPLILRALREKAVSRDRDPSAVYVELLARHIGQGVVELMHEDDHAFASGYVNVRSWRDRMKVLEDAGFVRATTTGNRRYAKVFLAHPALAMQHLHQQGKIPEKLWQAYRARVIEAKEAAPKQPTSTPTIA